MLLILGGCSNNAQLLNGQISLENNTTGLYGKIMQNIYSHNLDEADDSYVDLKTNSEDRELIAKAAKNLAIAHIAKDENILANYYIQEALQYSPGDEFMTYLLNKNQFLAAAKSSNEAAYLQKALSALKINRQLLIDEDYTLLADSMLDRVEYTLVLNNQDVSQLYKRLNKINASEFYKNKATILGIDSSEIIRPQ